MMICWQKKLGLYEIYIYLLLPIDHLIWSPDLREQERAIKREHRKWANSQNWWINGWNCSANLCHHCRSHPCHSWHLWRRENGRKFRIEGNTRGMSQRPLSENSMAVEGANPLGPHGNGRASSCRSAWTKVWSQRFHYEDPPPKQYPSEKSWFP